MLIIGEKINSSIPRVREAIHNKETEFIQELASSQVEAGAQVIDVNTAQEDEVNDMEWVIKTVQEVTDAAICIDSTNPEAIEKGMQNIKGEAMINSISMESSRINGVLPLVINYNVPVIALTMSDDGLPNTVEERLQLAEQLINTLEKYNYDTGNLYIDPLVLPVAIDNNNANIFFKSLTEIKEKLNIKTVSGLSNVSQSMPMRKVINRYFLSACMHYGMDAAILNPLDKKLMTAIKTTELLKGNDRFGRNYLKAYRAGQLED